MEKPVECPFCGVCGRVLDENELAYVIASNPRLVFGHLLVVPRRHVERPWEMRDDEALAIWRLVGKYQKLLAERIGDGCDVRENYRPFLKQGRLKVNHLHWHLIPRTNMDEIYKKTQVSEADVFCELGKRELDRLAGILGRRE